MHERLDARCRLESTSGGDGLVSSEYVVALSAGGHRTIRLRYVVVDAEPNVRLVAKVSRDGKDQGEQRAELSPIDGGTQLRWTVTFPAGRLARRLVVAVAGRQLRTWLAAVEREAVAASS